MQKKPSLTPEEFQRQASRKLQEIVESYEKTYNRIPEIQKRECDCDRMMCSKHTELQKAEKHLDCLITRYVYGW